MFKVDGENLSLTRGDDAYLYVGATVPEGGVLALRVYKDEGMENVLFSRGRLPDGSFLIQHSDTEQLPVGNLFYQVVLVANGAESVVLGPGTLTVTEEVH